jgi:hypothetical protein
MTPKSKKKRGRKGNQGCGRMFGRGLKAEKEQDGKEEEGKNPKPRW